MPDKQFRESLPVTLFLNAVAMVLGAFFICMALLISNRQETLQNREVGKVNQTYARATNCFAASTDAKRTPEYTEKCYEKAEQSTGVKVEHYSTPIKQ